MSIAGPTSPDHFIQGQLIDFIRRGEATSRPALERATGLGRKVVAQRIRHAIDVGLVDDSSFAAPDIGRPSRILRFREDAGVVYAGMIEANELRAAVATLDGVLTDVLSQEWDSAVGPDRTLSALKGMFDRMDQRRPRPPWALGIGVSASVDFKKGRLTDSRTLPQWKSFNVRGWLRDHYDAPIWVENETNLMALGEWHRGHPRDSRDLLFLLVDEEISASLVSRGTLLRGDTGSAGTIGHFRVADEPALSCRCGRRGCLETVASNDQIAQRVENFAEGSASLKKVLRDNGHLQVGDVADAARAGDAVAIEQVSAAVRALAAAAAVYVDFANPGTVVVAGPILRTGQWTIDLLEEEIRNRIAPLAAQDLTIRGASLEHDEGLVGAAILAVEQLFDPQSVGLWIENGSPIGRAAALQSRLVT